MTETEGRLVIESTVGQINKMSNKAQDRIGTARNILQRIQDLRVRLIGGVEEANVKSDTNAPEPVRPEVDCLSHNIDILGDIFNEIESNLQGLESL